jgi:hypothetical protein
MMRDPFEAFQNCDIVPDFSYVLKKALSTSPLPGFDDELARAQMAPYNVFLTIFLTIFSGYCIQKDT